jgi:hypothetical protein
MPIGEGALAVAYNNVEDGPVVLLHTEVPEKLSGLCTDRDRRIASSKRCDAIMAIAKCPFRSSRPVPSTAGPRSLAADRRVAPAQRFLATMPHAYRMHVQTEFLISSTASDSEVHTVGRTRGRLDIE